MLVCGANNTQVNVSCINNSGTLAIGPKGNNVPKNEMESAMAAGCGNSLSGNVDKETSLAGSNVIVED